jgi:hypothetical protein
MKTVFHFPFLFSTQTIIMYTRIIQDYPGHVWVRNPETLQETLAWNPIPGIYSPPCLFYPVFVNRVRVHSLPASIVGLIIGAEGRWLKFITESSGALYLFYRKGEFELWGFTDQSVIQATRMLEGHIHHMLTGSAEGEARGVGHQPVQEVHLEGV